MFETFREEPNIRNLAFVVQRSALTAGIGLEYPQSHLPTWKSRPRLFEASCSGDGIVRHGVGVSLTTKGSRLETHCGNGDPETSYRSSRYTHVLLLVIKPDSHRRTIDVSVGASEFLRLEGTRWKWYCNIFEPHRPKHRKAQSLTMLDILAQTQICAS